MNPTLKKIFIFVLIVGAIIIASVLIFGREKNSDLLESKTLVSTTTPAENIQSEKFLDSLSKVNSVKLDTTLFNSKAYQKLTDFSLPIILEDQRLIGRPNPFAPLGVDAVFNQPEPNSQLNLFNQEN